jgi:hypothetical protein
MGYLLGTLEKQGKLPLVDHQSGSLRITDDA